MSSCLVPRVKDFFIVVFDPCLSDKHKTVSTVLKSTKLQTQLNQPVITNREANRGNCITPNSFKTTWNPNKSGIYNQSFDDSRINSILENIDKITISNSNQNSIDQICKEVCNLLIDPAKRIKICHPVKTYNKNNSPPQCTNPWFNNKCERMRKEYFKTKNKASKHRSVDNLNAVKTLAKKYKKTRQKIQERVFQKIN